MSRRSQKGFATFSLHERGFAHVLLVLLLLGALAAGAFYYFKIQKPATPQPATQTTQTNQSAPLTLALDSPTDNSLVVNGKITVKGKTSPKTTVVFYTDTDDNSVESDANGNFEGNISLAEGINTITVTAFSDNGDEKSVIVEVVNSPKS